MNEYRVKMKLYQFETERKIGPRLINRDTSPEEAGVYCKDKDHDKNLFMLLNGTRLYYYVDTPHGYGWEACDGENGPQFL